ncbi:MAG: LytTR family transcriptional regulator DNA-binding domain-containing protein [Alphaproteobacteria bacterium]|nr:LytTR family transcriptional regulator DNA-binding domain-containing protein [Alphaproteobacteria bacterium]
MDSRRHPLLGAPRDWAIDLAVAAVAGAFLGVIGPFGSFLNGPAATRVLYWVLAMWCATVVLGVVVRLALALAARLRIPAVLALAGGLVVGSAPLSLLTPMIARAFWPRIGLTPLDWYWQCLAIAAPLVLIYVAIRRMLTSERVQALRPVALELADASPSPSSQDGKVLCLRMEDHYVRIHTAAGSRLVEGPFERVIATLGDREGLRVHRSWWVARAAVVGVEVDGRNLKLRLANDLRAPVSRASVAKLRQVGWLATDA